MLPEWPLHGMECRGGQVLIFGALRLLINTVVTIVRRPPVQLAFNHFIPTAARAAVLIGQRSLNLGLHTLSPLK